MKSKAYNFGLLLLILIILPWVNPLVSAVGAEKATSESQKTEEKSDEHLKPFDEVTKNLEKHEGLFTLYQSKEGQIYIEVQPNQLETLFEITLTLSRGTGDNGLISETPLDDYPFLFHRVNDEVQFIRKNTYFTATAGTPLARAVKSAFTDSILASMKIVSIRSGKKSLLLDANELFLSDLPDVARMVNLLLKGHYTFDSSRSSIENIETFPLNVEVETVADFATTSPPREAALLDALPDWRNIPLGVHYSFSSLPQENYVPRLDDDRIGYFTADMKDFSSSNLDNPVVRYIYRWNMTKKPVVFWIQNTTPVEYRDVIKEAILEWNKAFAKIGIDSALDVKIQPDDAAWSASDIRYNVIHWVSPSENRFAGLGPSHVNPLTGEIYNASVFLDGESLRRIKFIYRYSTQLQNSTGASLFAKTISTKLGLGKICALPTALENEGEVAALALALDSSDPDHFRVPQEFLNAYLKDVVMHEVGHCLGLRHNFHASSFLNLKQLRDPSVTKKTGLSASVMDYVPINRSGPNEKQGEYFSSTIGPYDYWAIEYGYAVTNVSSPEDEKKALEKIASLSALPGHVYSNDEDTFSPFHVDPLSQIFDLSSDSIGFVENRLKSDEMIWNKISKKLPLRGESFSQVRRAFDLIFSSYANDSQMPAHYIGGEYFNRSHAGDINAKPPLMPVPKSEQMRALNLLNKSVFSAQAFSFSPALLNKLSPDRTVDHFSDLEPYITPFDYPLLEKIGSIQENILSAFFRPVLLNRMLNSDKEVKSKDSTLTLQDLFDWMTSNFWEELGKATSIRNTRRNLQAFYLHHLIDLLLQPKPQLFFAPEMELPPIVIAAVPADAHSLAEYELNIIQARIQKALSNRGSRMDLATKSHLQSSLAVIKKALNARVHQSLGDDYPVVQGDE